ncbi:MAG: HesA/MoeB/ThiF family protein [Pseudomonadota bacterium]
MIDRYARQTVLPEIGSEGQERLSRARVVVIGAGGLGCPVLSYLVGAGVGTLVVVDPDTVELSNLHRQPLYQETHVGIAKAVAAQEILAGLNTDVAVYAHVEQFDVGNAQRLFDSASLVVDCADSFAATYTASDYCHEAGIPLVSASALSRNGYAGGFCGGAPSIRAVFPDLPSNLATCATAGVMGPVVGILGALQAQMALCILLEAEPSPLGQLVSFDGNTFNFNRFRFDGAPEPETGAYPFISVHQISDADNVIELRSVAEAIHPFVETAQRFTAQDFMKAGSPFLPSDRRTVFVCRSGLRAWQAARNLNRWWDGPIALVAAGTQHGEIK